MFYDEIAMAVDKQVKHVRSAFYKSCKQNVYMIHDLNDDIKTLFKWSLTVIKWSLIFVS